MLKRSQQYSEVFEPILHGVLGPAERLGQAFGFTVAADLADLADIADESLTQTLSRSINTSLTTFVMVLLLFIFGHTSIREFSLPLMVGVLCGTYSSICIATELWYVMKLYLGKSAIKKQAAAPAKVSKKAKN